MYPHTVQNRLNKLCINHVISNPNPLLNKQHTILHTIQGKHENYVFRIGTESDLPYIMNVLNWSYCGKPGVKHGWTDVSHAITQRVDIQQTISYYNKGYTFIVIQRDDGWNSSIALENGGIIGCISMCRVYDTQLKQSICNVLSYNYYHNIDQCTIVELSLYGIDPSYQSLKLGGELFELAEWYCCIMLDAHILTGDIVDGRIDLQKWYEKRGWCIFGDDMVVDCPVPNTANLKYRRFGKVKRQINESSNNTEWMKYMQNNSDAITIKR